MSKLKNLYYAACQNSHFTQSLNRLRQLEEQLSAPQTRLSVPFIFKGNGFFKRIRPKQSQMEIGELYSTILNQRPKVVLEVGTCHGGTLYLWCQAADPEATVISIDLPEGEFGGGYHSSRTQLYEAFAGSSQNLHLLRCNSHDPNTVKQVAGLIGKLPVDFLFIDGDHTYEGVKQDFELYSPLVADGGFIALHDILKREDHPRIEVWKLWQEIRQKYSDTQEWTDTLPGGRAIGIGLVRWRR